MVLDNFEDNLHDDRRRGGRRQVTRRWPSPACSPRGRGHPAAAGCWSRRRTGSRCPTRAERRWRCTRVGPLSLAETLKLVWSLPHLDRLDDAEIEQVWRMVGGHPRTLEYLDALLAPRHRPVPRHHGPAGGGRSPELGRARRATGGCADERTWTPPSPKPSPSPPTTSCSTTYLAGSPHVPGRRAADRRQRLPRTRRPQRPALPDRRHRRGRRHMPRREAAADRITRHPGRPRAHHRRPPACPRPGRQPAHGGRAPAPRRTPPRIPDAAAAARSTASDLDDLVAVLAEPACSPATWTLARCSSTGGPPPNSTSSGAVTAGAHNSRRPICAPPLLAMAD